MQRNKSLIMVLVVLAVMFFGYLTFFSEDETMEEVPIEGEVAAVTDVGADTLILLEQLRAVKMDNDIFMSAAFRALQDKTRDIGQQPVGRPNPFAPIGRDTGSISTALNASMVASSSPTAQPGTGSTAVR